ncbi:MAG: transcription-repair coupling factor [Bacilli bacterium]
MAFFDNLFDISNKDEQLVTGLNRELNCIYIYDYFNKYNKNILIVTNSLYEANDLYNRLINYTDKVLFFPMDDFMTSEASIISPELMIERLNTLNKILEDDKYIVISNLMGLLRYLPSKSLYESKIVKLNTDLDVNRDVLINKLFDLGYEKVPLVTKTGEMAIRGYVIDIFPIGIDNPIRIEFWGDTIDIIKYFDLDSQISNACVDEISIYPFTEFLLDNKNDIDSKMFKQKYLPYYSKLVQGIWNYLCNYTLFYYDYNQIIEAYRLLRENIINYDNEINDSIKTNYMFDISDVKYNNIIYMLEFDNLLDININNKCNYLSSNIDNYQGDFEKIKTSLYKYINSGKTVIMCIDNKNVTKRVVSYLDILDDVILTNEKEIIKNKINIINKYIISGFIYNDYVVISSNDLFGRIEEKRKVKNKYKVGSKISNIDNLEKGDFIVHIDHGIGQYIELCTLIKNGLKKDYIKLLYADGDILYLPVEKIDKITKFNGREGASIRLDKLGTDSWNKKKARVRSKLENIAGDLIRVSAERENSKGYAFSPDDENQILFESKFKYTATPDQERAINIIKREMEKDKPMDMLLCGDVGYGKTEVAFRAIFKAVNDGKQVAYLCPTTILSSQQYNSALDRFSDFPINIALLNRFTSVKDQNIIFDNLKNGKIDILFGTHKLLNDKVDFKDLGLLIIDEEQRFGVVHKEKVKKYKSSIDVLTLSATPIPRTLQMSMSGIRGLALIETPPEKRRPIQTYVMPESINIIKDAIYKELSRNGQIFMLYNSVEKIDSKLEEISKLVPEANIRYAHGRMTKIELENIMLDFTNHKFDILLCTTIIETGIDIPNVNTLIVLDADRFGLSQLYQIRGRIGRSDRIGYAYLMYNGKKELNDLAVKRLNTIKEFTELGSGFKIAMRDLSIRGAGDILGSEQSGFIDSIGIDLYLKMLKEEVDKLKGIKVEEDKVESIKPLIEVETHISSEYAPDDEIKLELHKLINDINSEEDIENLCKVIKDRFGKVTEEMIIYMHEEWFEKQAKSLNITETKQTKTYIEIVLPQYISKQIDGEKLFFAAYEISKYFRFSYNNNQIHIYLDTIKLDKHFVYYLNDLLGVIIKDIKKEY